MTVNETITIYNNLYNPTDRAEKYYPTVIKSASVWYSQAIESAKGNSTKGSTSNFKLRIPLNADTQGKEYISKFDWDELDETDVVNYWTIGNMDIVVFGEITDLSPVNSMDSILRDNKRTMVVDNYSDNTQRGSKSTRHWRLGGVG